MMYRIVRWLRELRRRRRDKRVELLGGHPEQLAEIQIEPFEPVLDQDGRVNRTVGWVSQLGADSFDEATGYPLDNLINAQGEEWRRRLRQQYLRYRPIAHERLRQANAIVEQYRHLNNNDLMKLRSAEIAVETALLALSGHEPDSGSDSQPVDGRRTGARFRTRAARLAEPASKPIRARAGDSSRTDWLGIGAARTVLEPLKATRSELRQLLEPHDAHRVPRWGEPGFRDGTLLAGRPRSSYVHALVLLLAAGADIGAFVQVVQLVLTTVSDWLIWLVVVGLTAVVLYIAHMVGAMLREARAHVRATYALAGRLRAWLGRRSATFVCTVIWLAIGLMAFWIRLTVPLPTTAQLNSGFGSGGIGSGGIGGGSSGGIGSGGIGGGAASSNAANNPHPLQGAAIFLGLYVATGIVAALGAYYTHNPYRGRYTATLRGLRKASERAAASSYQLGLATAIRDRQQAEIDASAHVLAEAQVQNNAIITQLKQNVRVAIASMAKDPAVTDAIFEQDHNPHGAQPDEPLPGAEDPGDPES